MNFAKVKGYNKLSDLGKEVFEMVYKRHNQDLEYKEEWIPVSVKEFEGHLKVTFKNGEWLHYLPDGTWY